MIEITGTGSLILGPCWAGDASLLLGKAQRVSNSVDRAAREWHYSRYVETTETTFLPADTKIKLAACVVARPDPTIEHQWRSTANTIRSLIKHSSRVYVIVDVNEESAEVSLAALRKSLSQMISLPDMSKIEIEAASADLKKANLFQSLVDALLPKTLVMAVRSGCIVRSDFLPALASACSGGQAPNIIVFDHDIIDDAGRRSSPMLMPGISSHLLLEKDYIGCAVVVQAGLLKQVLTSGAKSPVLPFGWRDVLLRLFDQGLLGTKLDHILLHCEAANEIADLASEHTFIETVLARRGTPAIVVRWGSEHTVKYRTSPKPLASIIIPFHDKVELLRQCITSILSTTSYPNFELILVDNRSSLPETLNYLSSIQIKDHRIRVIPYDRPFNYSAANNVGAAHATGDFLVFMNNDTEVLSPDWLDDMVGLAALPETGFVGARLHFGDGAIQHAGIVIGLKGMANHVLAGEHDIAMPRLLTMHTRDVSAVTAAAACIKADRFREIGEFNERFVLTGNDVEICLRARRCGLKNIYAGAVQLFHFEKSSRKDIPVYSRDIQLSLETYEPELSMGDPYWNSALSRIRADYLPRAPVEPTTAEERQAAVDKRLRDMQSRNLGSDTTFIARNDVDRATIEANRALNASYASGVSGAIRTAAFFVPSLSHIYRGGLYTCFRFAAALFREHKVHPLLVICSESKPNLDSLERQFGEAFPGVPFGFYYFNAVRDSPVTIPPADIAVATLWTTAYVVARYNARAKFYLIQDYEPLFEATGAGYGLIEASYRFGFFPICNSPGVAEAIAPYSNGPILTFEPAVDQTIFLPTDSPRTNATTRIVFYGRPNNPRNLFGLGIHALLEVKAILKDSVEILSVGGQFNPDDHGAGGQITNLGLLPSIDSVAALYRSSDIGLVFMQSKHPSYQPLEYMASGCATVTNVNESNSWLLRHRVNCLLTQITLTDVVDTIIELVRDVDLRGSIQAGGLATVRSMDWQSVESRVIDFMLHPTSSTTMMTTRRSAS